MMKNKKILFLSSSLISLSAIIGFSVSCTTKNKTTAEEQEINDFIKKQNPKIKPDKEIKKYETLASTINTEEQVKEWFDNLPQSTPSVKVVFESTAALNPNASVLEVRYKLTSGSFEKIYSFQETGFKQSEPINDQVLLEQYVAKLDPKVKPSKENDKASTLASTINTEEKVNEWFDGLPQPNNGIQVKFISSTPDQSNPTSLVVTYLLTKGNYTHTFSFKAHFFKDPNPSNQPAQTFKDFSQRNSFRIRMQTLGPTNANDPTSIWAEAGTAWSLYFTKKYENMYDWYLMTNFHVLYKSVSYAKGFTTPPGINHGVTINEVELVKYLQNNNVTTFDHQKTFLNLATYDFYSEQYKSLLLTDDIPQFDTTNKHENYVTKDMIKSIQVITDYQNKNIELFSKVDSSGNTIYNLDAAILKLTLDFTGKPNFLNKNYQRPNLIEQYRKNKQYYIDNNFDPKLSTGVSIAGNPASGKKLMPVNIKSEFDLKYESLMIGSYTLNNLYGPYQWSRKYSEVKDALSPGASGSAVYQLKNNDFYNENQQYMWDKILPAGIYWGGQAVNGIGFDPDNNYWDTSFVPFIWSGKTDKNVDLSYNVWDSFINNLSNFDKY